MSGKNDSTTYVTKDNVADRELVITRLINAPRELVFEAWTNPDHLIKWWGPSGFTNTFLETDFRKGGKWRYIMHGPDGTNYPNIMLFDEIIKPEKISYQHGEDENDPQMFSSEVLFEDRGGKTFLTLRIIFKSVEEKEKVIKEANAIEGGNQTLNKLEEHLRELQGGEVKELVITRVLNAPRDLVWKMYSEEKHLKHWWGPKGMEFGVKKFEFKPGGIFHYSMQLPDGSTWYGKFVYKYIKAPERLVFTVSFADENGVAVRNPMAANWPLEIFNTVTLVEDGERTIMTISGKPINATEEESNLFHNSYPDMEQGFKGTFDKLVEYLNSFSK